MEDKEKQEMLMRIAAMRLETKEKLRMLSYLANITGKLDEKEVNTLLDRLNNLNKLEEELKK